MGVSWENESAVSGCVTQAVIRLAKPVGAKNDGRVVSVYLGKEDVSWEIRNSHVAEGASVLGQYKKVRAFLVSMQQKMAQGEDVVMEGRDIGIRVLPQASLKIFMTADVDTRVKRKQDFLKSQGIVMTFEEVKDDLTRRDEREMNREIDPLIPTKDAWQLDTTGMTIEEVVETIEERVGKL
jgi:cytidylate kinase